MTSKHNYSLPPQAAFHHQPITLIGQSSQNQNQKVLMSHTGQGNLAISTPIQDMQNKITIPTSNIKLNIVPSLAQVMHQPGGGIVIDAKGLNATAGDHKTTILTTTTAAHRNDNAPRYEFFPSFLHFPKKTNAYVFSQFPKQICRFGVSSQPIAIPGCGRTTNQSAIAATAQSEIGENDEYDVRHRTQSRLLHFFVAEQTRWHSILGPTQSEAGEHHAHSAQK